MKFTFDETNYAQVLRRKALAKGKAEGRMEGVYMVAKTMLKEGISVELVSKTTALPRAEIVELSKLKA